MASATPSTASRSTREARLQRLVDDCLRRRGEGHPIDEQRLLDENPELLPELAEALRRMAFVDRAWQKADETVLAPTQLASPSPVFAAPIEALPGYALIEEIHRGGQGAVYRALQKSTGREVAVKVLHEGAFASSYDKVCFEREVQILVQLKHPNIVAIQDSGVLAGNYYFVMEYVAGKPLDRWVADLDTLRATDVKKRSGRAADRRTRESDAELPTPVTSPESRSARSRASRSRWRVEQVLGVFIDICDAVNAAHLLGIVHRDLKPGNIRVNPAGKAYVLDFGLAKVGAGWASPSAAMPTTPGSGDVAPTAMVGDAHPTADNFTITGQFVGTLFWASPEQALGNPAKIDARSDVYSLGVVLYQMLTGRLPYNTTGNLRDVLDRILSAEPTPPRRLTKGVDDEIETILLKCLSKNPSRRYETAGDLGRDLRRYLAGEPIEAKRDSLPYVLRKLVRRHMAASIVAASVALILVSASCIALFSYQQRASALERQLATQAQRIQDLRDFERTGINVQTLTRRLTLGWFLLEWNEGRIVRAVEIMAQTAAGSSERAAMQFLLDPQMSPESFVALVPESGLTLAYFVAGERDRRDGRADAARRWYEKSSAADVETGWIGESARARIAELTSDETRSGGRP